MSINLDSTLERVFQVSAWRLTALKTFLHASILSSPSLLSHCLGPRTNRIFGNFVYQTSASEPDSSVMAPLYLQLQTQSLDTSVINAEAQFPDSSTFSPELLNTFSVLLPFLTYPFLPTQPDAQVMLLWPSLFNFVFHIVNTGAWLLGNPYADLQFWLLPVNYISFLLGDKRLQPGRDGPQLSNFVEAARIALCIVIYQLFKFGILVLGDAQIFFALFLQVLWGTTVVVIGVFMSDLLIDHLAAVFYRFTTRRVSWWYWLPKDENEEEFKPLWSWILDFVLWLAAPVLLIWEMYSLNNVSEARRVAQGTRT